jgi:prepilin-type processing-associated H-X9-DG protein
VGFWADFAGKGVDFSIWTRCARRVAGAHQKRCGACGDKGLSDLTTTNSTHPYPLGGNPQHGKANILFHDGSVRLAIAYEPTKTPNTQLEDWMIRYPNPTKDSASTIENNRWKKGREVPF